jgi:hypothetical protein
MSRYGKLILIISAAIVVAILQFAFASGAERDEDANALREAGRLLQTQGVITNYSIAVWTDSLDMTLRYRTRPRPPSSPIKYAAKTKYRYAISGSFGSIWTMVIKQLNVK